MQAQPLETHPSDTQSLMAENRPARAAWRAGRRSRAERGQGRRLRAAAREIRRASAAILVANALDVEARALPARRPPRSTD